MVYALTRNGRVETTNYRTVRVPADVGGHVYNPANFGVIAAIRLLPGT